MLARAAGAGAPLRNVSARPGRRTPRSAYNPTVSADGRRVAFESAEGNLNFAKRYGQIRVFVSDLKTGRTKAMPMPRVRAGVSLSGYNPVISADGRHVAYQAQRRGGQSAVYVTDLRSGRSTLASRGARSAPGADDGVYDPAISGDGRFVAFTTAASNLGGGDLRGRTQVFVRDVERAHDDARQPRERRARRGRRRLLGRSRRCRATGATSRSRRRRATSARANRGSRVYVRDLRTRRTRAVSGADGFAIEPSISADGRVVAYTSIADGRVAGARPRRARPRPERLVSRATGRARRGGGPRLVGRDDLLRRHAASRSRRRRRTSPPASRTIAAACSCATCAPRRRRSSARRCPRPRCGGRGRRRQGARGGPQGVARGRRGAAQRDAAAHVGRLDLRQRVLPQPRPPDRAPARRRRADVQVGVAAVSPGHGPLGPGARWSRRRRRRASTPRA